MKPEEALEALSRFMYEELEHMDPTDDRGWAELTERERDLYRNVIAKLIDRRMLVLCALTGSFADDEPHRRSAALHMRLTADASGFLALVESVNRALKIIDRGIDLPELPAELVTITVDDTFASGAGELRVRFEPSEGFRGFVAALRTCC